MDPLEQQRLRLGTWNLLHGLSPTGEALPDLLGKEAAMLDCDVLAIQEVDFLQSRSGHRDQTADIAGAMGASQFRFLAALEGTPGETWHEPRGNGGPHYGIGLISKFPVRKWHELRLPSARWGMPLLVPTEKGPRLGYVGDEPRVALAAELDGFTVACAHLSFVPGRNIRQLRYLVSWLRTLPGPRFLLGDFNLPGAIPARVTGWSDLARRATYPSWQPRVQFDHLLADRPWEVDQIESPSVGVSDHRPLIARITSARSESER